MSDPFSAAGRFEERRRDADQQRALERMSKPSVRSVACPKCGAKPRRQCIDMACFTVVPYHQERYDKARIDEAE